MWESGKRKMLCMRQKINLMCLHYILMSTNSKAYIKLIVKAQNKNTIRNKWFYMLCSLMLQSRV